MVNFLLIVNPAYEAGAPETRIVSPAKTEEDATAPESVVKLAPGRGETVQIFACREWAVMANNRDAVKVNFESIETTCFKIDLKYY